MCLKANMFFSFTRIFVCTWLMKGIITEIVEETDPEIPDIDVTQHKNWHLLENEDCGLSLSDRIIGGKNATLGQYPWIARIGFTRELSDSEYYDDDSSMDSSIDLDSVPDKKEIVFECGGTLINSKYVITAAHCTEGLPDGTQVALVRLGEHNDLTSIDCDDDGVCAEPVQDFKPLRIVAHPEYVPDLFKHDIALIQLDRSAVDNGWVFPICSLRGKLLHNDFIGEYAEVAGWGYTDDDSETVAHVLQTVQLPIVNTTMCNVAYRRATTIGESQLCVGGIVGMDSCGGDSGGPLQKVESIGDQAPRYYLIGLVSFGSKYCGVSTKPAVYTRLANYMPWILDNIE